MAGALEGTRAVVLGLGHFGGGLGVTRWLVQQGARVTVTDSAGADKLAEPLSALADLDVDLVLGGHDGVDFGAIDLLVVNPAVPLDAAPVRRALDAGVEVTSEMALLLERWPGPVVGVTGSNGKSTTTGLIGAMLEAARRPVAVGGNLGGSLLDRLAHAGPDTVAVLELSSFMLEMLARRRLGPDVAVITNLTPNHLDRHGTFEAYRDAKAAVLIRARYAVLSAEDAVVRELGLAFHGQVLRFGEGGDVSVSAEGHLIDRFGSVLIGSTEIPLPGRCNRMNLAAAFLATSAVLADEVAAARTVAPALGAYRLPPHRLELVGEWSGVRWVDDSVSTTPESTRASLEAVDGPCILIAGGHDKGLDPAPLVEAAQGRVRLVLTVGEQGAALVSTLGTGGVAAESVGTVTAAVQRAARVARSGETVLLSPGYSSHDQFAHYEERGAVFAREVGRLAAEHSRSAASRRR